LQSGDSITTQVKFVKHHIFSVRFTIQEQL